MTMFMVRLAICFVAFVGLAVWVSYNVQAEWWLAFVFGLGAGIAASIVASVWTNLTDF